MDRIEVVAPDDTKFTGQRSITKGTLSVYSEDGNLKPAEIQGTDVEWLSKTLLLELNGWPRARWPKNWNPA